MGEAILIVQKSNFMFSLESLESDNFYCDSAPNILIDTSLFSWPDLSAVSADLNSKVSVEELWVKFSSEVREGPAQRELT